MYTTWKLLFWSIIIFIGLPVGGVIISLVLSSFTEYGFIDQVATREQASLLGGAPINISPPDEIVDALSFLSSLTDVKREDIKNKYRGQLIQWTLPVWDVSMHGNKFVIQTSSSGKVVVFCNIILENEIQKNIIKRLTVGDMITCKGIIRGYNFGTIEISPATLVDNYSLH